MSGKSTVNRKSPHPTTFRTQCNHQQKRRHFKQPSSGLIFSLSGGNGRDFNHLSTTQQIVFLLAISMVVVNAFELQPKIATGPSIAVPPNTKGLELPNPHSFFTPPSINPPVSWLHLVSRKVDVSNNLRFRDVTSTIFDCDIKTRGVSAGKICFY